VENLPDPSDSKVVLLLLNHSLDLWKGHELSDGSKDDSDSINKNEIPAGPN